MSVKNDSNEVPKILGWENNFVEYILDPIHGQIGITALESLLIKDEVFTRLKNIKQLGFVCHVYPSATHTRYEHSLGTLAITWAMLKRLLRKLEENKEKDIINLFSNEVIESLRLAALMHDLGHGPFSHSMEIALSYLGIEFEHDDLTSYLLTSDLGSSFECKSIKKTCDALNKLDNTTLKRYRSNLNTLLKPELRALILSIFNQDFTSPLTEKYSVIHYFLHDMIEGDLGSDRIDYLLRDTYFTGLGHRFSLSEILDNLYYIMDRKENRLILCVKAEGKPALELMLLTRYFHYQFIAHHPTNELMTAILQKRIALYLEKQKAQTDDQKQKQILDIALSNDWIEGSLPEAPTYCVIHRVALLDFQDFVARFFFYRVTEDENLRRYFQIAFEKYITEKYQIDISGKMLFNFSIESPRIPILHYYREKYLIGTFKNSVLVHDSSPFLLGLGRAYLENSAMTVYCTQDMQEQLQGILQHDPDFYKDTKFLKGLLREIKQVPDSLHLHDYLLFMIDYLAAEYEDRTIQSFSTITEEYKRLRTKENEEKEQKGFDYPKYERGYDHESNESFDYPSKLFNSMILFDVCKFTSMELKTLPFAKKDDNTLYKPTYIITVRSHEIVKTDENRFMPSTFIPLRRACKLYPKSIISHFQSDQENQP
jgi:uncharacterized protein